MTRHTSFDQRNEQIGIATRSGFIIYEITSRFVLYEAHFPGGGATCLSLLSDSNLVAVSGDDSPTGFQRQSVLIWDCTQDKIVRLWSVQNQVDNLFFRTDCLVVVHGDIISFYDCCDFELTCATKIPALNRLSDCPIALVQSNAVNLVAYPAPSGNSLNIGECHDPLEVLGEIQIPVSRINFFAFDSKGELLAVAVDDAKTIMLWSVMELKMIAKYKRGFRAAEVSDIVFDKLSNFFILSTKKGSIYVFAVPTPEEREKLNKSLKYKFSYDIPKGINFHYQFDVAGYIITGINSDGSFKQLRLDIEHGTVENICDKMLEI